MADRNSHSTTEILLIRDQGPVRFLTLNRPGKLNALNKTLSDELSAALHAADRDPEVSVIVIAGEGRAFSAGADLSGCLADQRGFD